MDPTVNLWDSPGFYRQNWQYYWFKVDIRFDDSLYSYLSYGDGSATNRVLANGPAGSTYSDLDYEIDYGGPNNY